MRYHFVREFGGDVLGAAVSDVPVLPSQFVELKENRFQVLAHHGAFLLRSSGDHFESGLTEVLVEPVGAQAARRP